VASKRISRKKLIEAARKDGFVHARGSWFVGKDAGLEYSQNNPIVQACFIGQMAINLSVDAVALKEALDYKYNDIGYQIINWNDEDMLSYKQILEKFEAHLNFMGPMDIYVSEKEYSVIRKENSDGVASSTT